jgi:hypothetical protein
MNIKKWNNFLNESTQVKKTIMNMFICRYESPKGTYNTNPNWAKCVETLRTIKFPTSVEISGAHYRGLAVQVLLDTNIEESASFCKGLLDKFLPEIPLIVISEVNVKIKNGPIGEWYDDDLVQPGRYFDKLVMKDKKGLFVHDENTPKIIKKTDLNKYKFR